MATYVLHKVKVVVKITIDLITENVLYFGHYYVIRASVTQFKRPHLGTMKKEPTQPTQEYLVHNDYVLLEYV